MWPKNSRICQAHLATMYVWSNEIGNLAVDADILCILTNRAVASNIDRLYLHMRVIYAIIYLWVHWDYQGSSDRPVLRLCSQLQSKEVLLNVYI